MRAGRRRLSRDERLAYLILLPALGAVFVIVTIPFVLVLIQSVSADDGTLIGLRNYTRALGNPLLESLRQRFDRRAVAQILEPLTGSDPDALLLLLDVRHGVKTPAAAGCEMVASGRIGRPRRSLTEALPMLLS